VHKNEESPKRKKLGSLSKVQHTLGIDMDKTTIKQIFNAICTRSTFSVAPCSCDLVKCGNAELFCILSSWKEGHVSATSRRQTAASEEEERAETVHTEQCVFEAASGATMPRVPVQEGTAQHKRTPGSSVPLLLVPQVHIDRSY